MSKLMYYEINLEWEHALEKKCSEIKTWGIPQGDRQKMGT